MLVLLLLLPLAANNVEATTSDTTIQTEVTQGQGWELLGKIRAYSPKKFMIDVDLYVKVVGETTFYGVKYQGQFYTAVKTEGYGKENARNDYERRYRYKIAGGELYFNL